MITKLNKNFLDIQGNTVYDFNELTLQELLCKFFDKINQCIDVSNTSLSFLEWLKKEGISIEVQKEVEKMYLDGRLTEIINTLSNDVKGQIKEIKGELESHKTEYNQHKLTTGETLLDYSMQLEQLNNLNNTYYIKTTDNPQEIIDRVPRGSRVTFANGLHEHGLNKHNSMIFIDKPIELIIPKNAHLKIADNSLQVNKYFELITNFYGEKPISDLEIDGSGYTLNNEIRTYDIQIDGKGTFKYQIKDGYTNELLKDWTTNINITGDYQPLSDGVKIKFNKTNYDIGYGCMVCSSGSGYYLIRIGNGTQTNVEDVEIRGNGVIDMNQENNAKTNYYATVLNCGVLINGKTNNIKVSEVTVTNSDRSIVAYGEHTGAYLPNGDVVGGISYPVTNLTIENTKTNNCMAGILLGHPEHRGGLQYVKCNYNEISCSKTALEPNFLLNNYEIKGNFIWKCDVAIHCWRKSSNGIIKDNKTFVDLTDNFVIVNSPSGWENSTNILRYNNYSIQKEYPNIENTTLNNGDNNGIGKYSMINGQNNIVNGHHSFVNGAFNNVNANKSSILGGLNNTINGNGQSTILNGEGNQIEHGNTTLTGKEGKTRSIFYNGHSQGKLVDVGDVQIGNFLYYGLTTNATPRLLTLDGLTPKSTNMFVLPYPSTVGYKITLVWGDETLTEQGMVIFRGLAQRKSSGNKILFENNTTIYNPSSLNVSCLIDNTTNALAIRVVGLVDKNIKWNARIETTEITV